MSKTSKISTSQVSKYEKKQCPIRLCIGVKGGLLFYVGANGKQVVVPDKPQKVENFHFLWCGHIGFRARCYVKLSWFGVGDNVFESRQLTSCQHYVTQTRCWLTTFKERVSYSKLSHKHYIAQTRSFSTNFKDKFSYSKLSLESHNLLKKSVNIFACLFLYIFLE